MNEINEDVVMCYKKKCGKRMKHLTDAGWACRNKACEEFEKLKK